MHSTQLRWTVLAAAAGLRFANAADPSDIIPQELQAGFESSGVDLQVSFTGDAVNGFKDGAEFESDAVAQVPTFALGDSSAISSSSLYTVIMVDTTCDDARILHFAQSNFKYNFDVVKIESESQELQAYKAPGSFGEQGDERKYSFLMFDNPNRDEISELRLPAEGEAFDVNQFREDNGFEDAVAGVGMVVKLGGQANCGGNPSDEPEDEPESSSAAAPASSARATPSEAASSAPARTSSPAVRASSRPAATTTEADEPESTATEPSETDDSDDTPSSTAEDAESASDIATEASSVLLSPPTGLATTTSAQTTGSSTASSSVALQTDSGASGISTVTGRCMVAGLLVALAACLA